MNKSRLPVMVPLLLLTGLLLRLPYLPGMAQGKKSSNSRCVPVATLYFSNIFANQFGVLSHQYLVSHKGNQVYKVPYSQDVPHKECDLGFTSMIRFEKNTAAYYSTAGPQEVTVEFLIMENNKSYHIQVYKTDGGSRDDDQPIRYLWYKKTELDPCTGTLKTGTAETKKQEIYVNLKSAHAEKISHNSIYRGHRVFNPLVISDFRIIGNAPATAFITGFATYRSQMGAKPRKPFMQLETITNSDGHTGRLRRYFYKTPQPYDPAIF